jgi:hypothetical protein
MPRSTLSWALPDAPEMPPGVISGHPGRRSDREGPIKGCRSPFLSDSANANVGTGVREADDSSGNGGVFGSPNPEVSSELLPPTGETEAGRGYRRTLGWVWGGLFVVNMILKEASMSRYAEWSEYKKRSWWLLPGIL